MVTLSQFLVAERFSFEVSNVRLVEDFRTRNNLILRTCRIEQDVVRGDVTISEGI